MDKETIEKYFGNDTVDPIKSIDNRKHESQTTSDDDIIIFNHLTHSIIKLRKNGMIDIFTRGNNGIRIDPKTDSINFFTKDEKHHIGNYEMWAQKKIDIKTLGNINISGQEFNLICPDDEINIGSLNINKLNNIMNSMQIEIAKLKKEVEELKEGNNNG